MPLPISAVCGRFVGHAFPPNTALGREREVGENCVLRKRCHGVGVGLDRSAGSNAKKSCLWIDSAQTPLRVRSDPGNVIAYSPDLPSFGFELRRRDHHREIGFSTCARKGGSDVSFFAMRVFHADDEHMLGHPAFVPRHVRGDTQGKTFFPEKSICSSSAWKTRMAKKLTSLPPFRAH